MMTIVIVLHSLICILLVVVILMQSGRGGGLTEQFQSAESMFGAKTNSVMVRITSVLAILFIVTSVSLAVLSLKKDESLMSRRPASSQTINVDIPIGQDETKALDKAVDEAQPATVPATP